MSKSESKSCRDRPPTVLAFNRGSSSLRLSTYEFADDGQPQFALTAKVERIGQPDASLTVKGRPGQAAALPTQPIPVDFPDHGEAIRPLLEWLEHQLQLNEPAAVGHRVVHGGPRYNEPELVTDELVAELRRISPFDPDHLPAEIDLIEAIRDHWPAIPQVACFDTAFHRQMPRVARLLPIPRKYDREGIERYGFHGISYAFLMEELARVGQVPSRVILAHLGAGASLVAVRDGRSIDTTMAFTPTAGLPMATRTGDLDPGLFAFLLRSEQMTADQFHDMVNHCCGLVGVSETSGDVRDLLTREATDVRAAEALAVFCYQTKKWIGAMAAALGGLDMLVFAGGIGENAPEIRRRICDGLQFLGVEIDDARNKVNDPVISTDNSSAAIRVIRTDEELMIARATWRVVQPAVMRAGSLNS